MTKQNQQTTLLKIAVLTDEQKETQQIYTNVIYTDVSELLRAYAVEYQDLDASTQRCAAGNTVRDFLQTIITIKCTFKMQDSVNTAKLMDCLKQKDLQIMFYDIETDTYKQTRVYPSTTRSVSVYTTSNGIINNEISVDFIQFGSELIVNQVDVEENTETIN